jgi:hypothetical protein
MDEGVDETNTSSLSLEADLSILSITRAFGVEIV